MRELSPSRMVLRPGVRGEGRKSVLAALSDANICDRLSRSSSRLLNTSWFRSKILAVFCEVSKHVFTSIVAGRLRGEVASIGDVRADEANVAESGGKCMLELARRELGEASPASTLVASSMEWCCFRYAFLHATSSRGEGSLVRLRCGQPCERHSSPPTRAA